MDINRYKIESEAIGAASAALEDLLKKASVSFSKRGTQTLLLLSDGDTLELLEGITDTYFGEYLTITVIAERFSENEKMNNFAQITQLDFYESARSAGCSFIDTRVKEGDDVESAANYFEIELRDWKRVNPDGNIFATFSLGKEGQIAEISRLSSNKIFEELFLDKDRWVAHIDKAADSDTAGFTTTLTFMKMIDRAVCLVVGNEKQGALTKLANSEGGLSETPARILRTIEDVKIYTDLLE